MNVVNFYSSARRVSSMHALELVKVARLLKNIIQTPYFNVNLLYNLSKILHHSRNVSSFDFNTVFLLVPLFFHTKFKILVAFTTTFRPQIKLLTDITFTVIKKFTVNLTLTIINFDVLLTR